MTETIEDTGPIQLLTLAFPGNQFRGEILIELDRLKGEGIVRILDMLIVRKDPQANVMVAQASDLNFEEATALGSYFGALAGFAAGGPEGFERGALAGAADLADGHIFDEHDVFRVTQTLPADMTACLVLIEHTWAKSLRDAVDRAGGLELTNEWLEPQQILGRRPAEMAPGVDPDDEP